MASRREFYEGQLARFESGERFDAADECLGVWGQKPGNFAESMIAEMMGGELSRESSDCRIPNGLGSFYIADGWIPRIGCYLESKYQAFWTSGTAHEKLPMFLIKAAGYDREVVLVLGGEHESGRDPTSRMLWKAYHHPEQCATPSELAMLALVNATRHRLRDVVRLSELTVWFDREAARQGSR